MTQQQQPFSSHACPSPPVHPAGLRGKSSMPGQVSFFGSKVGPGGQKQSLTCTGARPHFSSVDLGPSGSRLVAPFLTCTDTTVLDPL